MERFQKYNMQVNTSNFIIKDVNYINDELWQAFNNFYLLCTITKGLVDYYNQQLPSDLVSASLEFFNELKNTPNNCTPDMIVGDN